MKMNFENLNNIDKQAPQESAYLPEEVEAKIKLNIKKHFEEQSELTKELNKTIDDLEIHPEKYYEAWPKLIDIQASLGELDEKVKQNQVLVEKINSAINDIKKIEKN